MRIGRFYDIKKFCECGCGQQISAYYAGWKCYPQHFVNGHGNRMIAGEKHHLWKGGRRLTGYGYIKRYRKGHHRADRDEMVFEHILVFEDYHNCCVLKWAAIHHKNHIKTDNRIDNLQGMTKSKHTSMHQKERYSLV